MKGGSFFSVVLIAVLAFSHLGTVRKTKTTLQKTQSDTVTWKQREEELKDGPKGAPTPSFKLYGSKQIMTDPPMTAKTEEKAKAGVAEVSEVDGIKQDEDWWSDEEAGTEEDASFAEEGEDDEEAQSEEF